jgi:hypothetical protein
VHLRRPSARAGLLAAAAALIAMLVAVPNAGAATFAGGPFKIDFKASKLKVAMVGQDPATDTKTGGTFTFSESGAGSATMTKQASGQLTIGGTSTQITLTHANKKKIVLKSLVEKLTGGKGQVTAKVGGKGGAVAFFDQATTNKLTVPSDFTTLDLASTTLTLTAPGAAALNKAFGLKKPARGKKDLRLKKKQKMGTSSFSAHRSLTVNGGESRTVYDVPFYDRLKECDITLSAVAPATGIPADSGAPRGGAVLPVTGGLVNAKTLRGAVLHDGGTLLDRPEPGQPGNTTGKARYNSALTMFEFSFAETNLLRAFVVNLNAPSPIGNVTGTLSLANMTDTGGSLQINGDLVLSETSAQLLSSDAAPLGADCPIPAGSKIGNASMNATVN